MDKSRTLYQGGFLYLVYVIHVKGWGSGSKVWDVVSSYYTRKVLLPSDIPMNNLSSRACCCVSKLWCSPRPLNPCVHVGFVVKTDVNKIMPTFKGSRYKL